MVAKPWKCAMVAGIGLVLVAGCTTPKGNQTAGTTPATESTATAQPAEGAQPTQGTTKVPCANQNGQAGVDSVVLYLKNGTGQKYPGTNCGIIWGPAASGQIPDDKTGQPALTTGVCVWAGDHWDCGPTLQPDLTKGAAKPGVKK